MKRRTFLSGAALAALAGCSGNTGTGGGDGGSDGSDGSGDDSGPNPDEARTALDSQPTLGPAPGDAPGLIVAFEDPSCTRCRAFDRNVFPEIRSNLVETGAATFVFRGYPVVYEWGNPASHALEATFARDADAFWALLGHYFDEQDAFDTGNVLDRTGTFLSAETDVDAAEVVADAESGAYDDAVSMDVDAAEAAEVSGTPTVFLFRDGEYRTRVTGSVSFDLVRQSLGL